MRKIKKQTLKCLFGKVNGIKIDTQKMSCKVRVIYF